jgi:hypothetical protein
MKTIKNKLRKISLRKRKTSRRKASSRKKNIYKRRKTYKTKKNNILKGGAGFCPPDNQGFSQHSGECWNDSDMMIFCFTDGIKEKVQDFFTLIDDDLDIVNIEEALYSLYNDEFDEEHKTNFNFLIPFNINYLNETKDDYARFKDHAIFYISNMYRRYKNLMPETDPFQVRFNNLDVEKTKELKRTKSTETTYECVNSNYLIESINALSEIETDSRKRHGGSSLNKYFNICIINYFIMTFKMNLDNARYITINNMSNVNPELNDILAVSISSRDKTKLHRDSVHANAFIICNQTPYFYDDNGVNDIGKLTFINQFDWKSHILKLKNKEINNNNFFNFPECREYLKGYNMNRLFLFEMTNNVEYVKTNINNSDLYLFDVYYSYNSLKEEFNEKHQKELESLKNPIEITDKELEEFDFEKEFEDIDDEDELERRLNDINGINLEEEEDEDEEDDLERRLRELKSN